MGQFSLKAEKRRRLEEPEDYDPKAEEKKRAQHVPVKPKGEIKGHDADYYRNQPVRDKVANIGRTLGQSVGYSPSLSNRLGEEATVGVDFIPGVGDAVGAVEAKESLLKGDYGDAAVGAALTTVGLVPGIGDVIAATGRGAKKAAKTARQFALKPEGKAAAAPTSQFAAKPEKRKAITATSLRQMPLDEAIAQARTGEHLIPKKGGGFVGAPYSAQTMDDLELIRKKFDEDVAAGAAGSDWYPRAQAWIKEVAGPDPARQSELARNLALFSAQADPGGNLGFSITARNNAIMGMTPVSSEGKEGVVRTGQQWDTYKKAFDTSAQAQPPMMGHNGGPPLVEPQDIQLGAKTGVYSDHMDPTRTSPTTGTNDIWHARALGYTTPEGKPWESALTSQQHAFMDAETVLAVERANQAAIGGRTDWTPGEIQAAPWVAGKGRGLAESRKDMTVEQGVAEAAKTYPDYAPKFTAYGTHEMTPGRSTDHLPSVAGGDQATRDAFAEQPGAWWQNEQGKDILYDAQGAYHGAPTSNAHGVYGDPVQFNPMQAARPMVNFAGPPGERVLEPASRQLMTGTEGFRAMMDAQDMGGFSIPLADQKASHNNAFELAMANPTPTREQIAEVMVAAGGKNMPNIVHYGGPRAAVTNFETGVPTAVGAKEAKAMQQALGERATVKPTRLESGGVFYEDAWRGGAPEGKPPVQGTDMVTNEMLSKLKPLQEQGLDKPEVRAKVLERFDRDAAVALERGDIVRTDLQKARELFAKGGFKALRDNLGKGLLPAAAVGLFLKGAPSDEEG